MKVVNSTGSMIELRHGNTTQTIPIGNSILHDYSWLYAAISKFKGLEIVTEFPADDPVEDPVPVVKPNPKKKKVRKLKKELRELRDEVKQDLEIVKEPDVTVEEIEQEILEDQKELDDVKEALEDLKNEE